MYVHYVLYVGDVLMDGGKTQLAMHVCTHYKCLHNSISLCHIIQ